MRKIWTPEEIAKLQAEYAHRPTAHLAVELGLPVYKVYGKANALNLHKSDTFMQSEASGRLSKLSQYGKAYRYPKGNVPANKGQKMSAEVKEKVAHIFFKKGNAPHNSLPPGTEKLRADKRGNLYWFIKVEGRKHMLHKHVYLWEQHYGKAPPRYCIVFKDRNPQNCTIENLECITREENMKRNTIQRYPEELKSLIRITHKLKRNLHEKQSS